MFWILVLLDLLNNEPNCKTLDNTMAAIFREIVAIIGNTSTRYWYSQTDSKDLLSIHTNSLVILLNSFDSSRHRFSSKPWKQKKNRQFPRRELRLFTSNTALGRPPVWHEYLVYVWIARDIKYARSKSLQRAIPRPSMCSLLSFVIRNFQDWQCWIQTPSPALWAKRMASFKARFDSSLKRISKAYGIKMIATYIFPNKQCIAAKFRAP